MLIRNKGSEKCGIGIKTLVSYLERGLYDGVRLVQIRIREALLYLVLEHLNSKHNIVFRVVQANVLETYWTSQNKLQVHLISFVNYVLHYIM